MNRMSYREIELLVIRWAEARKIIPNSTAAAQAMKTNEEAAELLEAATVLRILKDLGMQDKWVWHYWFGKYRDAVGDIVVTLINGCALADVDLVQCLAEAYEEIKDRKGTLTPEGIFVKE